MENSRIFAEQKNRLKWNHDQAKKKHGIISKLGTKTGETERCGNKIIQGFTIRFNSTKK